MLELLRRAEKTRSLAAEQGFAVVISVLRLSATVCRCATGLPAQKRDGYETKARQMLGKAFVLVRRCDITPEQHDEFQTAFRDLTDRLPIRSPATVVPIDAKRRFDRLADLFQQFPEVEDGPRRTFRE